MADYTTTVSGARGKSAYQVALDNGFVGTEEEWLAQLAGVHSVNTRKGDVVLSANDVGLGNVDNTSDADKPISTATQSALDLRVPVDSAAGFTDVQALQARDNVDVYTGFANRDDFAAKTFPRVLANGTVIYAGGVGYVRRAGASLPNLPNWDAVEPFTIDHCGGIGDGVADDQAAYDEALFRSKEIYVPTGKTYLVTNPTNSLGRTITGHGRIISAVTGGYVQQNSAMDTNPVMFRSHLWKVKELWRTGGNADVIIFGDSTATSGYGVNIEGLVRDALRQVGCGVAAVVNEAVAGDSWHSKNLATILEDATGDLGRPFRLAIIKFGINDASALPTTIEEAAVSMRNAMRQRLQEIRSSAEGAIDELSILIIGPNALGNNALNATNRNNLWLERIHPMIIEAAKDFQAAYYAPYMEARNATGGESKWLDEPLVHPLINHNLDIWGRAMDSMFRAFGSPRRNTFYNAAFDEGTAPTSVTGIIGYPMGISVQRALSSDGYPFSGEITTVRNPDNVCHQTLWGYSYGFAQAKTRNWITGSNAWSEWSGGGVTLTLQNGWEAYGGQLGAPTAKRTADGLVVLSGVAKNGTVTSGTVITTLPDGYRPSAAIYVVSPRYVSAGAPNIALLYINTNGQITTVLDVNAEFLGLDGITFFATG